MPPLMGLKTCLPLTRTGDLLAIVITANTRARADGAQEQAEREPRNEALRALRRNGGPPARRSQKNCVVSTVVSRSADPGA